MKVSLHFRSDFYELFTDDRKIIFTTDDIRFIKIDKSHNINSIVHFNLLILVLFVIFLELIYFPFLFFLALLVSLLFFFNDNV
jgi:hypothetical protein